MSAKPYLPSHLLFYFIVDEHRDRFNGSSSVEGGRGGFVKSKLDLTTLLYEGCFQRRLQKEKRPELSFQHKENTEILASPPPLPLPGHAGFEHTNIGQSSKFCGQFSNLWMGRPFPIYRITSLHECKKGIHYILLNTKVLLTRSKKLMSKQTSRIFRLHQQPNCQKPLPRKG